MNIILNNQPLNNRGDESAHKALIRALCRRYPQDNITVLYPQSELEEMKAFVVNAPNVSYQAYSTRLKYGYIMKWGMLFPVFRILWYLHPSIKKLIDYYKQADLIIGAPGGISMGGFQNWDHLFLLYLAKFTNKPLAYYGRSFGPFPTKTWENRIYKKESYKILRYFSYLSIRDKKTEQLADKIGLKYNSTVDTAFLDTIDCSIPSEIIKQIKGKYMVFVPNLLIWHYNYKNRITKEQVTSFFVKLINEVMIHYPDYQILMLPQTFGNKNPMCNDVNFFYELASIIKAQQIVIIPDTYSSDQQQAIIKQSEFVVGARYHSIVFSINNNVPFISLSYEHKMAGLLMTLGLENRMVDITNAMDSEDNLNTTEALFQERLISLDFKPSTSQKAKVIAQKGFDGFCECIDKLKNSPK